MMMGRGVSLWVAGLVVWLVFVGSAVAGGSLGGQVRVSQAGPDGDANFRARSPEVAFNSVANQFLVVWSADDVTDGEFEIFGRLLDGQGNPVGGEFRISDMGPDGNTLFDANAPAVVFNSVANEYLVTWYGNDNTPPFVVDEFEIFVQRLSATGAEIGTDMRISDMGPDGDPNFGAFIPAVAFNPLANEYLVTWSGEDNTPPLVDNEAEIFAQRLSATGAEIGGDTRISDMGPDGNPHYGASSPAVAYNPATNEYLVTWSGEDNTPPLVDSEFEIFVQRLSATGAEIGGDMRISDMGPDGNTLFRASEPAVVFNSVANEYLVSWQGDDKKRTSVDDEFEIFVQRLTHKGVEIGTDTRISDMGPDGNTLFGAFSPAVVFNSVANEYLVTWSGDDYTPPLVDDEFEIFGQRLSATGAEIGTDTRISSMGPDGNTNYGASSSAVAYNPTADEYLVTWSGDDNTPPLVDGEFEIFVNRTGADAPPAPPDVTPAVDTRAPAVRLATRSMTLGKRRVLRIPLRCPAHETMGCTGTTTIRTRSKVPRSFLTLGPERALTLTLAKARRVVFVKNKTFTINGGQTKNIKTRLSKRNAAILRRLKKVRVQVITKARDQAGNTKTTRTGRRIILKAPARKSNA